MLAALFIVSIIVNKYVFQEGAVSLECFLMLSFMFTGSLPSSVKYFSPIFFRIFQIAIIYCLFQYLFIVMNVFCLFNDLGYNFAMSTVLNYHCLVLIRVAI
jgi:hypothetical protein